MELRCSRPERAVPRYHPHWIWSTHGPTQWTAGLQVPGDRTVDFVAEGRAELADSVLDRAGEFQLPDATNVANPYLELATTVAVGTGVHV